MASISKVVIAPCRPRTDSATPANDTKEPTIQETTTRDLNGLRIVLTCLRAESNKKG
jgi:hypothetical protein